MGSARSASDAAVTSVVACERCATSPSAATRRAPRAVERRDRDHHPLGQRERERAEHERRVAEAAELRAQGGLVERAVLGADERGVDRDLGGAAPRHAAQHGLLPEHTRERKIERHAVRLLLDPVAHGALDLGIVGLPHAVADERRLAVVVGPEPHVHALARLAALDVEAPARDRPHAPAELARVGEAPLDEHAVALA